jgi:hypothetical protein
VIALSGGGNRAPYRWAVCRPYSSAVSYLTSSLAPRLERSTLPTWPRNPPWKGTRVGPDMAKTY